MNTQSTSLSASRLCQQFQLTTPIALAPMAHAADGALTAACARAGALGLLGGGYADLAWTQREWQAAVERGPRERIGCGFITWCIDRDASPLDFVLEQRPRAIMLSFGDPRPYAARIAASGAALFCQVQHLDQVGPALEAGAVAIVAQGNEAGGHSVDPLLARGTLTLVPEMADWLAAHSPGTLLLAAGGIADGRTLAAVRLLGADGAMLGTRLWATQESAASKPAKEHAARDLDGSGTIRSPLFDILANRRWPDRFEFTRAERSALHREWEGRRDALEAAPQPVQMDYQAGVKANDFSRAFVTVGEAAGLIHDVPPAEELIARMTREAQALLGH